MIKQLILSILVISLLVTTLPNSSAAFGGNLISKGFKEAGEYISKKLGREVVEESGEALAKKTSCSLVRYGAHGRRAFSLVGDDALKVASRYGQDGIEMLAAHPKVTARFLARHADDAVPIWKTFGREGTEFMAKHPGIAKPLFEKCGSRGLALTKKLSTKNLTRLNFFSKKVSRENLDEIITWSLAKGDEVMNFLWRHKGKIITGATVHAILQTHKDGFKTTTLDENGNPVETQTTRSLFGHIIDRATSHTMQVYPWLFPLVAFLAFAWLVSLSSKLFSGLKKPLSILQKTCVSVYNLTKKSIIKIRHSQTSN